MAIPILEGIGRPKRLIADKAYDADKLRAWLKARRIKPVIPSTASRNKPYPLDGAAYRRRNVIERMFGRLKNWRRIATRASGIDGTNQPPIRRMRSVMACPTPRVAG